MATEQVTSSVPTSQPLQAWLARLGVSGKVLAIEAGKTIIVDQPEVIALANQHGLAIVSLESPGPS